MTGWETEKVGRKRKQEGKETVGRERQQKGQQEGERKGEGRLREKARDKNIIMGFICHSFICRI